MTTLHCNKTKSHSKGQVNKSPKALLWDQSSMNITPHSRNGHVVGIMQPSLKMHFHTLENQNITQKFWIISKSRQEIDSTPVNYHIWKFSRPCNWSRHFISDQQFHRRRIIRGIIPLTHHRKHIYDLFQVQVWTPNYVLHTSTTYSWNGLLETIRFTNLKSILNRYCLTSNILLDLKKTMLSFQTVLFKKITDGNTVNTIRNTLYRKSTYT